MTLMEIYNEEASSLLGNRCKECEQNYYEMRGAEDQKVWNCNRRSRERNLDHIKHLCEMVQTDSYARPIPAKQSFETHHCGKVT